MYDVVIVGGGIAGCTVAILLASTGHKTLLLERAHRPAHKLCGEFLSIEAADSLFRLNVMEKISSAGPAEITNVEITTQSGRRWNSKLPGIAYGLSRYKFDQILIDEAALSGAVCRTGESVVDVSGALDTGFFVRTSTEVIQTRLVIGACGKKGLPGRLGNNRSSPNGKELVAFKQHYTGSGSSRTIELYTFQGGYCGINLVEDGKVNVCWLTDRNTLLRHSGRRENVVTDVLCRNRALARRLDELQPIDNTFCAVGGVTLAARGRFADDVCLVGDSSQMIAPFCGDGMGMALRSGVIAAPLCTAFLNNELNRQEFIEAYTGRWRSEFSTRLALGGILQNLASRPTVADFLLTVIGCAPSLGDYLVRNTRGLACAIDPIPANSLQ